MNGCQAGGRCGSRSLSCSCFPVPRPKLSAVGFRVSRLSKTLPLNRLERGGRAPVRALPSDKADRSGRERGRGGVRGRAGLLLSCAAKIETQITRSWGGQTARRGGPLHGPAPLARDG